MFFVIFYINFFLSHEVKTYRIYFKSRGGTLFLGLKNCVKIFFNKYEFFILNFFRFNKYFF